MINWRLKEDVDWSHNQVIYTEQGNDLTHSTVHPEGISHVPAKLTFSKKIVNWPCDKLNSASLFIILLVGQEVEIWMSTWSFRPAAYIEWMVAVLMTKRYKWKWAKLGGAWDFGVKGAVKEVIPVVLVFNHDLPENAK